MKELAFIGILIVAIVLIIYQTNRINKREIQSCIKWETYEYYDSSGTSLWIATKNPAYLGMNGYKKTTRCIQYKSVNSQKE